MEKNLKTLCLSELHAASSYLDRIFHALIDLSLLHKNKDARDLARHFNLELYQFVDATLVHPALARDRLPMASVGESRRLARETARLMEALLNLDFNLDEHIRSAVDFINLFYQNARSFHALIEDETDLEIQLPRVNLVELREVGKEDEHQLPSFHLDLDNLLRWCSQGEGRISSLNWQREKRYQQLISKGHQQIFDKDYAPALETFTKAMNYLETAEILTLIGWTHSFLEDIEKAKAFCLKAIQKDPDYGPPYNDLGTYLLSEGQVNESLKWFELAKKALNYQNREYPYINAGRAYMAKKDLSKALDEFAHALTLAPYHHELHETVEKLKSTIHKSALKKVLVDNSDDSSPPVF